MAPREDTNLLSTTTAASSASKHFDIRSSSFSASDETALSSTQRKLVCLAVTIVVAAISGVALVSLHSTSPQVPTGPYQLVECQEGTSFFDAYDFYDGADSLGSAGYNTYVNKDRAIERDILNITIDPHTGGSYIYMKSAPTEKGPRESIRLEGKKRYNRGLFILNLDHMPNGPGVWPAWWLTDEDFWPDHGEIDIVEGINNQTQAKTALHTSAQCSMYAQVPSWSKTGVWDRATGIPDTYTGLPNFNTSKEADDCWNMAAHQWGNQGCVAIDDAEGSIGKPFNENGGGVYALEWDPINRYIKSWSFGRDNVPVNLEDSMRTASNDHKHRVMPDPSEWGLPYAYFAIGEGTGCSADHFQNMHIVFNLAFCGNVAGNRFFKDCPDEARHFNVSNDPILSCNDWIASDPKDLEEAYWKIRGVYVYERTMERPKPAPKQSSGTDGGDNNNDASSSDSGDD